VGIAENRAENMSERIGRFVFVWLLRRTSDLSVGKWFTDFYLLDRNLYKQLASLPPMNQFIRGRIVDQFEIDKYIGYQRKKRHAGKSKFNFARKYSLAFDALLLHGTRLIRRTTLTGFLISFATAAMGLAATLIVKVSGHEVTLIAILLNFLIVTISFLIGMIGICMEYLIRIHHRLHSVNINNGSNEIIEKEVRRNP
jgi:dolichol-phosphate mannosyltransferase